MLHHGLIDGIGGGHILHDGAHVDGNGGRSGHLAAYDGVNQLLLASLGVLHLQRNHLHTWVSGRLLLQQGYGLGLVGLDTYIAPLYMGRFHQQVQAHQYFVGMFHHEPVVRRNVGFALHSVKYHALCLGRRRRT